MSSSSIHNFNPRTVGPEDVNGPWLMGGAISLLLQGVLLAQYNTYFSQNQKDTMYTRVFVIILVVLNGLKSIETIAVLWYQSVVAFGDLEKLLFAPWYETVEPLGSAIIGFVVQVYFGLRLARLTRNNWLILLPLFSCIVLNLAGAVALVIFLFVGPADKFNTAVTIMLVGAMAADTIITLSLFVNLIKSRTGFKSTDSMISRIVVVTWTSAAPPFVAAILNLVTFMTMWEQNSWYIFFNMILNYLYSISMMYTINSRSFLRRGSSANDSSETPAITTFALRARSGNTGLSRMEIHKNTVIESSVSPGVRPLVSTESGGADAPKLRSSSTEFDDVKAVPVY